MFITNSYVSASAVVGMRRVRTAARAPATTPLATALVVAALANTFAVLAVMALAAETPAPDPLSALGAILPPFVSDNFDELVKAATATCEVIPQQLLFSRASSLELPQTQLVEYSRTTSRRYRVLQAHKVLRTRDTIVLYVPGWWNTPSDNSSQTIVNALMTKHASVFLLDTRLSFCRGYVSAVSNVTPLARLLYSFIKNLHKKGVPMSSIHLIGFSLGAHVAGLTGKLVKSKLNATLGQITALDPARPCFARTEHRLYKSDAEFVQVIHSSTGVLGLEEPVGHADVYVNGVRSKHPECRHKSISLDCDHAQAWKLFSASAINEKMFMGRQCSSWAELLQDQCSGNVTVLGYSCRPDVHGMFLYKSQELKPAPLPELQVFNPFNILRWPMRWNW